MFTIFKCSGLPLVVAFALAASPALARDEAAANTAGTETLASAQATANASKPARVVKYCAITKPAGSMLPRKTCKTEQGWSEYGYTVEELMQ